ncbi:MAG: adenylate kinase [Candidatus Solibacter sp.]|jgi:adenylate kinase|nr:adenylate kinase [Candidatus Solibacter sp.]
MLTHCLEVPHISTGDMLRDRIRAGTECGTKLEAAMQSGSLVSDAVVNKMVEQRLSEPDTANGFILDGYPRTLDQAAHFAAWLKERGIHEVVIHLAVDYNIIIARLTGRRQCPMCGTLYNVGSHPPKVDSVCDRDGQALVIRDDDREEVIRERLEAYCRQTKPVLDYFRAAGHKVIEVDASNDPPEKIYQTICWAMTMESA